MGRSGGPGLFKATLVSAILLVGVEPAVAGSAASGPFDLDGGQIAAAIAHGRGAVNTGWDEFVRGWTVSNPSNDTTARLETPYFLLAMQARRAATKGRIFTESDAWPLILGVRGKVQFVLTLRDTRENLLRGPRVRLRTPDSIRQPWLVGPQPIRPPEVRPEGNAFAGEVTVTFLARRLDRSMTVELEITRPDGRLVLLPFPLGKFR